MGDSKELTELQHKVDKIVELTRATRDEAVVALHDCDDELDKAIDMILEGESVNAEWRSAGKKRKPKNTATKQAASGSAQESNDKTNASGKCHQSTIVDSKFLSFILLCHSYDISLFNA